MAARVQTDRGAATSAREPMVLPIAGGGETLGCRRFKLACRAVRRHLFRPALQFFIFHGGLMNIVVWVLTGGILGWAAYLFLHLNEGRGMSASVIIGAVGGFVGGKLIAPLFAAVAAIPSDFSSSALIVATVVAGVFLAAGNLASSRWGI